MRGLTYHHPTPVDLDQLVATLNASNRKDAASGFYVLKTGDEMSGPLVIDIATPPGSEIKTLHLKGPKPVGLEPLYYLLYVEDTAVGGTFWMYLRADGAWVSTVDLNFTANRGPRSTSSGAAIRFTTGGMLSGDIEIDSTVSNGTGKHLIFLPGGNTYIRKADAVTAVLTDVLILQHNSSGTPAADFGTAVLLQGESTTTENRDMMRLGAGWEIATDASRKSYAVVSVFDGSTEKKNVKVYTGEVQIHNSNLSIETAGKTVHIKEGANACMGIANCSFINGEQETTVATTAVTTSSRVFLSIMGTTSSMNNYVAAWVDPADITAGSSFKITTRGRGTGSCDILWWIVEPA